MGVVAVNRHNALIVCALKGTCIAFVRMEQLEEGYIVVFVATTVMFMEACYLVK